MGSQDDNLQQRAAESLGQMEAEQLADIKPENKQELVEVLRQMRSESIPELIQLLGDQEVDICNHAVEILAEIGREAIPDLIQRLGYVANKTGYNAAMVLGTIGT